MERSWFTAPRWLTTDGALPPTAPAPLTVPELSAQSVSYHPWRSFVKPAGLFLAHLRNSRTTVLVKSVVELVVRLFIVDLVGLFRAPCLCPSFRREIKFTRTVGANRAHYGAFT